MQSDLDDGHECPHFVLYETQLLYVMHPQMNLEWFWYMDVFLDVHGDVFQQFVCRFQQQTDVFGAELRFAFFSGSCMLFSTSLWTR